LSYAASFKRFCVT